MTRDEALQTAHSIADQKGWPWLEPVSVAKRRKYILFGQTYWRVRTNVNARGVNAVIEIDDLSGMAIAVGFLPR